MHAAEVPVCMLLRVPVCMSSMLAQFKSSSRAGLGAC